MTDIALKASIDFRDAEKQVDNFVKNAKRKMSEIMAAANRPGGSMAGQRSTGTRRTGGAGAASSPIPWMQDISVTKRAYAQLMTLEKAFAEGSIKWRRALERENIARLKRDGAMTEGNFRLKWRLDDADMKRALQNKREKERQDREATKAALAEAKERAKAEKQLLREVEIVRREAAKLVKQEAKERAKAEREARREAETAQRETAKLVKQEAKERAKAEREAASARKKELRDIAREQANFERETRAAEKARARADRQEAVTQAALARADIERSRVAMRGSRAVAFGSGGTSSSVSALTDGGTGMRARNADFYERQAASALIAEERARREVERAEKRVADAAARLERRAQESAEREKKRIADRETRELASLAKREAAEKAATERAEVRERALSERRAVRADRAARGDVLAVGRASNTALGVNNRIGRQLGSDPSLQTRLSGDVNSALTAYTQTVQRYGAASVQAARASIDFNRTLQNVRNTIAEKGGLFQKLDSNTRTLSGSIDRLGGSYGGLRRMVLNTQVALSALTAAFGMREIMQTAQQLENVENTLRAVSPSADAAAANMVFLRQAGDAVGFSYLEAGRSFAQFTAAATNAGASVEQTQQMFLRLTVASRNFGLSSADTDGVIRALTQSMSKGRFSAEEIRQQLGDRMPVAMAALEQATGKTGEELDKMMRDGKITTAEFAIPFIEALFRMSGGLDAAERASQSLSASLSRLSNAWANLVKDSPALVAGIGAVVDGLARFLNGDFVRAASDLMGALTTRFAAAFTQASSVLDSVFAPALRQVTQNLDELITLGIGALAAMMTRALIPAALGAAGALGALLTPVGLALAAVAGLTVAFVKFRNEMVTFQGVSAPVIDVVAASFEALWDTIKDLVAYVSTALPDAFEKALAAVGSAGQAVMSFFGLSGQQLQNFGQTISQGFVGMVRGIATAVDASITLLTNIVAISRAVAMDVEDAFVRIGLNIRQIYENIFKLLADFIDRFMRALPGIFGLAAQIAAGIGNQLRAAFGEEGDVLAGIARSWAPNTARELNRIFENGGSTAARDFVDNLLSGITNLETNLTTGLDATFSPIFSGVMARAAARGVNAAAARVAVTNLDPGFFGNSSDLNAPSDLSRRIGPRELMGNLSGTIGNGNTGSNGNGSGGSNGTTGAQNAVAEFMDDLRRQTASAGRADGAAAAYADTLNRLADAARNAGGAVDITKESLEAQALVTERLNKESEKFIRDTNRSSDANYRLVEAHLQGADAAQRAEVRERAMAEARKYAREFAEDGVTVTDEYKRKVEELIPVLERAERAERAVAVARNIANNRDEIEILQAEQRLISANANEREREVAALRARQAARGTGLEDQAGRSASQVVELRQQNEQLSNSWNEMARVGEQAFDRIGSAITEAFAKGEIKALKFSNIYRAVLSEIIQATMRMAIINPLLNSMMGGSRPTMSGMFSVSNMGGGSTGAVGGLAGLAGGVSGLAGIGSSISNFFGGSGNAASGASAASGVSGLAGIGSSISNFFGGSGNAAPGSSAFTSGGMGTQQHMGDLGFFAPSPSTLNAPIGTAGTPGAMGVPAGGGMGGMLGGMAMGFGMGSMVGGLIAGKSAARQQNAQIGAGIGAVLLGPLGGLVGGAIGGMLGPKKARTFYNLAVDTDETGNLRVGAGGGKRADAQLAALRNETEQATKELNARMAALGLRASGSANLGSGVRGARQFGNLNDALNQFNITASDARVQGAIDRLAGGDFNKALDVAAQTKEFIAALDSVKKELKNADDPIAQIVSQFDSLRESADKLGFGMDEVTTAQEKAIRAYREQQALGPVAGLADFARSLRVANDNSGTPMSRLASAELMFNETASLAASGDIRALGSLQDRAETFRQLTRDVFGTGIEFAGAEQRIIDALGTVGQLDTDQLTGDHIREQTETLVGALGRLQDEVKALRREVQQQGDNPLAARAA